MSTVGENRDGRGIVDHQVQRDGSAGSSVSPSVLPSSTATEVDEPLTVEEKLALLKVFVTARDILTQAAGGQR